ncbi:helix-turn-helix domain-containing protein [Spirosoma sp. KUDC1026]|uniref:helix-turn-helix domain-containing protein n=1 Tax=Spirosoma sp. KUDC1026 TaxID=2745947 RepID=UPI00159BAA6E|nr:helix-turn-helix domain-containing protein [Spirosoma sp. KUDC1026]QKZ13741.1 AraC family transcriptional regulator [Spirosoma sp. KUDC1026]
MQHLEIEPPEALRSVIKCFWYTSIDFAENQSNFEVVPDGYAELIFHFGHHCSIAIGDGIQPLPSPFLVGLLNQPVYFHSKDRLEIIGVRCFPWTVFELLGLPSGKDGVRTIEHPVAQLQARLAGLIQAGQINEALTEVAAYFLAAQAPVAPNAVLQKAGSAMRNANGTLPVSQVAAAAHATVRTLERKFKQSAGYTVKDVSALMRFEQVRDQLWLNPDVSLAGLAYELGYTDQAHLSREFKRYSGTTPAAFARRTKKARQTIGDDFVVFIQA